VIGPTPGAANLRFDAGQQLLLLDVSEEAFLPPCAWRARPSRYSRGVLAKYAKLIGSTSAGTVTD